MWTKKELKQGSYSILSFSVEILFMLSQQLIGPLQLKNEFAKLIRFFF